MCLARGRAAEVGTMVCTVLYYGLMAIVLRYLSHLSAHEQMP